MTVTLRTTSVLLITFCATFSAVAQKAFKPVKASLKAAKYEEALKQVEALEKDSTVNAQPRLYRYGVEANIGINDAENEKIYLKQAYDTVKFFNSTAGIYDYILKCDKAERLMSEQNGDKPKYRREHAQLVRRYYRNLGAAGRFFFSKEKFPEAMRMLALYLDMPGQDIWGNDTTARHTQVYRECAYLYLKSAYRSKNYAETYRYGQTVLADTGARRCSALEYLANSAKALGDTVRYAGYLRMGLASDCDNPYFFTRMADARAERGDYAGALALADSMARRDSANALYLEAKSLALLNLQRYDEAIEVSKKCLELDSSLVEINFYIGAAYCNQGAAIVLPANINSKTYRQAASRQKSLYAAAMPYMERYRKLRPDEASRWAPLLYRIYLSLNKGKQFEEIDKILNTLPKQ